jgi:hypothetical protein
LPLRDPPQREPERVPSLPLVFLLGRTIPSNKSFSLFNEQDEVHSCFRR